MRYKNKIIQMVFFSGILFFISCTKQLNMNSSDPNGVGINLLSGKDVFAQALASSVTNKIGVNSIGTVDNYDYAQNWMGYWARNTDWAASGAQAQIENFQLPTSFSDGIWASLYHNIYDYNYVIANSATGSILPGASRVMRSMVFQDLVDQFGNVPYSQAANPAITTPKYDSATSIYKDLVVQIDSGILSIQASQATADDASDVMFKGSKSLWIAFANTIKLRIILRQVPNVYAANDSYVTSTLTNAVANGGFLGPGQDALINPGFHDATQAQNPFWGVYGFQPNGSPGPPIKGAYYQNYDFFVANVTMLDFLDSISDPRYKYFYGQNANGGYGGNVLGASNNSAANTSHMGPGLLQSPAESAWLLMASQSLFMQSEAAYRGMLSGDYKALYQQGVEESFRFLTVPQAMTAADQYINGTSDPLVNIASSSNPVQTIMYQKWIAECGLDALEAYSDYRRTGYPYFSFISASVPAGTPMPVRLLYPQSEYTQNAASLQANLGAAVQPASAIYQPIFWQN
jgi:hypothetical protein